MFEISEIIMPNVIHFLGVSGIPEGKQSWCLGQCPEEVRNFQSMCRNKSAAECPKYIQNKFANCNTCPESIQNI